MFPLVSGRCSLSFAFVPRHHPWIVQVGFLSITASSRSTGGSSGSTEESFSWVSYAIWSLEYETGATTEWAKIVLAVVLMCWVPVWLAWCWIVFYKTAEGGFKVRSCFIRGAGWGEFPSKSRTATQR